MARTHKDNTISFRPTEWQRILIEERASLSGMLKKEFIARSCIYSNICYIGKKDNILRVIGEINDMKYTMQELARGINAGEFLLSDETFEYISKKYVALLTVILEIVEGASYLLDVDKTKLNSNSLLEKVKANENYLEEILESLEL